MDIKNQEFKKSLRGLDESEVSAFLETVATQWQEQQDELRRATERIADLESKIEHYQRIEEALQEAISSAKSSTAAALGDAERRGQLIVEEADLTGRQITNNALLENERLKSDSTRLEGKTIEVAARLRAFLTAELELLEHFDRDNPTSHLHGESQSSNGRAATNSVSTSHGPPATNEPADADNYSRMAAVAAPAVEMHTESRQQNGAMSGNEPFGDFEDDDDSGEVSGFDANSQTSNMEASAHPSGDQSQHDEPQNIHAMPPLPERAPQSRAHDWQPSIARATASVGVTRSESSQHPEVDNSWPTDSEEVMNPDAGSGEEDADWDGDRTEPGQVFAEEPGEGSFNAEEPYNVSEDELEKIRRILDDLD